MTDLVYQSYDPKVPADNYWDLGTLNRLFAGKLWSAVAMPEFRRVSSIDQIEEGGIIVFPARRQVSYVKQLKHDLERLKWAIVMLVGDEANEFPASKIALPHVKLWIMSAHPDRHVDGARKIGSGVPPIGYEVLPQYKEEAYSRPVDYFFSGQLTHERRQALKKELDTLDEFQQHHKMTGLVHYSEGFTQGIEPALYFKGLASSKTAPCPSGAINPESFRLFEALEAGCVPIVDGYSPEYKEAGFWTWFFDEEPPFPVYTDTDQIRGYIEDGVKRYPEFGNNIFAWWQRKKRDMAYWVVDDIVALNPHKIINDGLKLRDKITVLMPSSPIPAHPSTDMIEKTIADIRIHLPDCEILIMVDGLRDEQEHYRENYNTYIQRLLWLCNNEWHNVLPILFPTHSHQATMTREVLKMVKTPMILFVEHDTPLTPDRPIEWDKLSRSVMDGTANIIRFLHESHIPEEHKHLVLSDPEDHHGTLLIKTKQWSQRPHLASTAFYRHMLATYFNPASKTMIEDVIHQIVEMDMQIGGPQAWYNWRIWIYAPRDPDGWILRSYNLDGRQDDPKFDMEILPVEKS